MRNAEGSPQYCLPRIIRRGCPVDGQGPGLMPLDDAAKPSLPAGRSDRREERKQAPLLSASWFAQDPRPPGVTFEGKDVPEALRKSLGRASGEVKSPGRGSLGRVLGWVSWDAQSEVDRC